MKRSAKKFFLILADVILAVRAEADLPVSTNVIPVAAEPEAPMVYAGSNAKTKAGWQTHYTLGPNDVVNFSFYGRPELARADVRIGPDGRVSYLQAQGVMASGLTIDELRQQMTTALAKYYRQPSVIVTPGEFHSKKICILGKVINKGVYTLDRPLTVIEAIAEAGGLETGLYQLNTVELADLPRSFLIRNQKRVPVDFDKLFRHGDLSQNILLEPNDYLYFPSAGANEIYVLGSVQNPGAQGLSMDASVIGAVALAGGFTQRAYQQHVLVVRGGLDHPGRFVVDAADILSGKAKDFRLEPRDIVYVADHPWAQAEDLADLAATAFIQTMVTVWTGGSIGPLIKSPIVPMLH